MDLQGPSEDSAAGRSSWRIGCAGGAVVDFVYVVDIEYVEGSGHDSRDGHWSWTTWRAVVTIRVTDTGLGPREGQWSHFV